MACKFSCTLSYNGAFKENEACVFISDAKDEYRVTYRSNACRDLLIRIAWTVQKQALVTVKLYTKTFKKCFSSKGAIVDGNNTISMRLRGAFNVCSSLDYNILCIITVLPHVKFEKCKLKSKAPMDESLDVESEWLSMHEDGISE